MPTPPPAPNSAPDPEVSVLLVNWNTREMTLACLRTLFEQTTRTAFEVIVVDNASTDGSAEAIAAEFPQVILMAETENHGFGRATNLQAARARGRLLLLLNTDTLVLDHAIDELVEFSHRQPQARIWGGRTLFADGSLNPTSCWGTPTPWNQFAQATGLRALFPNSRLFSSRNYPGWLRDDEREVGIVTGCLFLIEKSFWDELGGFDRRFFMYGEETDLCMRAQRRGARPMITPRATIVHYGGGSTRGAAQMHMRLQAVAITLADIHFPRWWSPLGKALLVWGVGLRMTGYALAGRLKPRRFGAAAALWREVWQRRAEWRNGLKPG